ncbi:MAG: metal-dependent transcriptional regulator [Oscillospiraceae bacterium]|nr:metal-dependent transcriptional regulator [Oscillospiraceae bacterium]
MQESGEMYLETILILGKRRNYVRAVDVAEEMGLSKASVSRALGKLKTEACVIVDPSGHIAFTEKGRRIAERIYERHQILTQVLMRLGVDEATASADACKMEHDVSDRSFDAIKRHIQQYST